MPTFIYCLYSTEDGVPRYVGRVAGPVSFRFKEHITAALEKEPGILYDWMRDLWRRDADVGVFTLQEGIREEDEEMFEQYWKEQFKDLLDVPEGAKARRNSQIAERIIAAIKAHLEISKHEAGT